MERMKICYIAHAIGGDIEGNLADIRRIVRRINMDGGKNIVPFVPYYVDIVSLDDKIPAERERGIKNDTAIIESGILSEMWLTGPRISAGMAAERDLAVSLGIPVIDFIGLL